MRFNRLDLNLLVALDALLTERNITRAAARLHVGQSAMSDMLGRLREFFGDELLTAVGRNMEVTALGSRLAEPVRDLLLRIHATMEIRAAFDPAIEDRCIRIMASDYAVQVLLGPVVQRMLQEAPRIRVQLYAPTEDAFEKLRRGENDFLIIPKSFVPDGQEHCILHEDRFCAVVWESNASVGEILDRDTYARLGHVAAELGRPRSPTVEDLMLKAADVRRDIRITAFDFTTMARLVVGTELIATMPTRLAQCCAASLPLRLLPLPIPLSPLIECLEWHDFREHDPCHQWVRGLIMEVARTLPSTNIFAAP